MITTHFIIKPTGKGALGELGGRFLVWMTAADLAEVVGLALWDACCFEFLEHRLNSGLTATEDSVTIHRCEQ